MKEQIPQPAPVSRTLQGKTKESNTASVTEVLQAYKNCTFQRQEVDEEELLQGKFETAQRDELEDDELLQGKFETTQRQEVPNNTGMPDNLKAGVEQLSGLDMSDVKVHYNSSKPASVQAYAYTQGTDIHVAPGQEKHLGHEAWHVAQQKQGRVQPTTTVIGMLVNDNAGLEKEADVMGGKALQMKAKENKSRSVANSVVQKKSNAKQDFGLADNRPEIVALRNRHGITNNTLQARQLRAFQEMAGNVAQLVNIPVGFDNSPTQSMFAGPADDLTTTGLGNCIAIVAYHTGAPSQGAVMRHYDTVNAFVNTVFDPVSGGNACTFNGATIGAVAQATAAQLLAQVPAAAGNIGFAVALGRVWSNVNQGTSLWQSRFNLINAIVAGVGGQPIIAAGTANFDVATSTLS